jgi:nicotinamide mononucleotide transporter
MSDFLLNLWANPLELWAIVATLLCVWLNVKENIWGWPMAIVSSGLYAAVFVKAKLYSDAELQVVFIAISLYGWYKWYQKQDSKSILKISHCPSKLYLPLLLIALLFTVVSGYVHATYTDASLPYADSSLTAISLVAQWLMARKYLQNWYLWLVANVGYIALYFSRNLHGTAYLYVLLLIMAYSGLRQWQKTLQSSSV